MLLNCLLLFPQSLISSNALFLVVVYLLFPIQQVGLHPFNHSLFTIDFFTQIPIIFLQLFEILICLIGILHVILVGIVKLFFEIFDLVFQIDPQLIDRLKIFVSYMLPVHLVVLSGSTDPSCFLIFDGFNDTFHFFLFSRALGNNLIPRRNSSRIEKKLYDDDLSMQTSLC